LSPLHEDVISGKTFERTGLADLFDHLRPGDILAVVRLDRLGRSLRLLDIVENLQKREVALLYLSLEEKLDTSSAAGELLFHVFGPLAQFERHLIAERTP
jgi:DNA invertase Pin-like site-specific DNA recombinase